MRLRPMVRLGKEECRWLVEAARSTSDTSKQAEAEAEDGSDGQGCGAASGEGGGAVSGEGARVRRTERRRGGGNEGKGGYAGEDQAPRPLPPRGYPTQIR